MKKDITHAMPSKLGAQVKTQKGALVDIEESLCRPRNIINYSTSDNGTVVDEQYQ